MLKFEDSFWKEKVDSLPQILDGALAGVVLRDALDDATNTKLKQAIDVLKPHFYTDLNNTNGFSLPVMFGQLHKTLPVDLMEKYFACIAPFCAQCNEAVGFDLNAFIAQTLEQAFMPYQAAALPGFLPFSFRIVLPEKGGLYLHRDSELLNFIHDAPSQQIQQMIKPDTMMSWFFTLQQAEEGGELWVADSKYADYGKQGPIHLQKPDGTVIENENELEHIAVKTPAASLLVFRGGSHWHKVVPPAKGSRQRITFGGFMALSINGTTIYYWS